MNNTTTNSIQMDAETTRRHIGIAAMMRVGAKNFVKDTNLYQFNVGRGLSRKIMISLADDDTYTVELWSLRRGHFTMLERVRAVFADQLADVVIDLGDR